MKKEEFNDKKGIIYIAGAFASIIMILIVFFFIKTSLTGKAIIESDNNYKNISCGCFSDKDIDKLIEERLLKIKSKDLENSYICINSFGKIYISKEPCIIK